MNNGCHLSCQKVATHHLSGGKIMASYFGFIRCIVLIINYLHLFRVAS
jgi:hypothetical protein